MGRDVGAEHDDGADDGAEFGEEGGVHGGWGKDTTVGEGWGVGGDEATAIWTARAWLIAS